MAETLESMGYRGGAEIAFNPNKAYEVAMPTSVQRLSAQQLFELHSEQTKVGSDALVQMMREESTMSFLRGTVKGLLKTLKSEIDFGAMNYHESLVARAKKWIIEHATDETLSLDSIAKAAKMSPYHFSRVFRQVSGESPISYLRRIRVEKALEYLESRKCSATEAAVECGFQNAKQLRYHLTRFPDLMKKIERPLSQSFQ